MLLLDDCIDALNSLDEESVDTIVTSPPYNKKGLLGSVNVGNQIWGKFNIDYNNYGDNMSEDEYQAWMIAFLQACHRVIKPSGSIFFNHKPRRHKNRCHLPTDFISKSGIPLYQLIIWDRRSSPNIRNDVLVPCTEHIYWLCKKKPKVFRNQVPTEFRGEVWTIPPSNQKLHPAPFPELLVTNCIQLTTAEKDTVCDPFMGSGTTGIACKNTGRQFIGIEKDPDYFQLATTRINGTIHPHHS